MPANPIDDRKTCVLADATGEQALQPALAIGAELIARGRPMRLETIVPHRDCCELHLLPVDAERRVLLWPFDRPRAVRSHWTLKVCRLRRCLRVLREIAASERDPLTPRACGADLDIVPYQIAPAITVASGEHRILLADEVGLGKTMQAGWIVADLCGRDRWSRILIAVPAAVRSQWASELRRRFALESVEADARWMREAIADLPVDVNPWSSPGIYLVSHDFLKRPDVARAAADVSWDLLVVDEAHTAAAPTERFAALAEIAARTRRIVSITATPYSGDASAYQSMISLGMRHGAGDSLPVIFRRFREDVGDSRRRRHRFVPVRLTRAETRLQRMLERYTRMVWRDAPSTGDARLAMTILRKRALSSPIAAGRSLARRLDLLASRDPVPLQRSLFDEEPIDDEVPAAILGAPGLQDAALEVRSLRALVEAAATAARRDSKLAFLGRLLRRARGESAVIFTEYRDTLLYLASVLPGCLQLHGAMSGNERTAVQARFNRDGGLLLATDAAAEGLNLQEHCRLVINYELPWNPGRLEQRIGRVDRIGQRRVVHAVSLLARDTAEDLVVANVVRRLHRVKAALGPDDPLAALLDSADVARMVIADNGPAPSLSRETGVSQPPPLPLPDVDAETARRLALQLGPPPAIDRLTTLVSRVRTREIVPGLVVVYACAAVTADGETIARTVRALHLREGVAKPRSAADARETAQTAIDVVAQAGGVTAVDASVDEWISSVRSTHERSIDRQLARETALRASPVDSGPAQPGLFDRRVAHVADREERMREAAADEHERRAKALTRRRTLSLTCDPVVVLIAWR
jgi:superfamily II DNA or RNA helicase